VSETKDHRLRTRRELCGATLERIASLTGFSISKISRWETGAYKPNPADEKLWEVSVAYVERESAKLAAKMREVIE